MLKAVSFSALKRRVEAHHAIRSADHPLNGFYWPMMTALWSDESLPGVNRSLLRETGPMKSLSRFNRLILASCWISRSVNCTRGVSWTMTWISTSWFACFCGHLSAKPGNTSTKSLGLSLRTISRRIVDTDTPNRWFPLGGIRRPS